ncbi:MAG: hypothetical protein AAB497_01310 [Patescibacteria group bacterium]
MKKDKIIKVRLILFCVTFLSIASFVLYQISCKKAEFQKWDQVLSGRNIKQLPIGGSCLDSSSVYILIAMFILVFTVLVFSLIIATRKREDKLDELVRVNPLLVAYSGGYYEAQHATVPFIKVSLYNDVIVVAGFEMPVKIAYKDIVTFDIKVNEYADKIFKILANFPWPINIIMNLFYNIGITKLGIEFMDNDIKKSITLYPLKIMRIAELLKIKLQKN